jgi:dienelactone hydrolase
MQRGSTLSSLLLTLRTAPAYFAYPESKSTRLSILLLTDVIGYESPGAQLCDHPPTLPYEKSINTSIAHSIADQLAANGYFVVMPDLFHGDPVKLNPEPGFDLMKWLEGHPVGRVDPVVVEVIAAMKEIYGVEKIGAAGYCFGAKVRGSLPFRGGIARS